MASKKHGTVGMLMIAAMLALFAASAGAVRKSDVLNSKHNLSATSTTQAYAPARTVKAPAGGESQICAFCHTPHGASTADQGGGIVRGQLWNRRVPASTSYTGYTSSSLDAATIQTGFSGQPGGSSKLCLSCHDGTLAVNTVNVINGASGTPGVTIPMSGITTLPAGTYGATSGYTPVIGADLTNDHPISMDFTSALAARDGELRPVNNTALQNWQSGGVDIIGKRGPGYRPLLPLEGTGAGGTGQVQCSACHDPHIVETDTTKGNQMFLRTNRFQEITPGPAYSQANDSICVSCHDKNGAAGAWAYSAHANPSVAMQTYTAAAVTPRQFPSGLPVWKASCLNCHNGHTVQGARRLLAEGTDGAKLSGVRQGGNPALENTCYQCHTATASSIISSAAPLIDIEGDMKGTGIGAGNTVSHPNAATTETHDIGGNFNDVGFIDCTGTTNKCGADGAEQRAKLGASGNLGNRHAECTDCHNPHRVAKVQKISDPITGAGYPAGGAHKHEDAAGYVHNNIASGVLRGTWGVEPVYSGRSFFDLPSGYIVKRGDPGATPSTFVTEAYVTREYQVCLKCHSDYGYTDDNVYPSGATRPPLGGSRLSPANLNGRTAGSYTRYTNQAREFQAPATHQGAWNGKSLGQEAGSSAARNTNNARSWHPVIGPTGRSTYGTYKAPWNNAGARGVQTMYCSDCHGSTTTSASSVIPNGRSPTAAHTATSDSWGPHGGGNMMLKGTWYPTQSAGSAVASTLCLKCHTLSNANSGFTVSTGHADTKHSKYSCSACHTAVVHGWKKKALLVDLSDVGPEAGLAVGTNVGAPTQTGYSNGPYYMAAQFRVLTWRASGSWTEASCDHSHK